VKNSWRWPGWAHLGYAAWLEALAGAWLLLVYGGTDLLTRHRALRVPVHLPFEPQLPFVPGLIAAYLSIHLVFALAPFALPARRELRALMWTLAAVVAVAGVGFLLVPADLAYPAPAGPLGIWAAPFRLADTLNLEHNLVPSLHVALSVACIAVYARTAPAFGAAGLWAWAVTIAVATVLTHQHHLVDAVTGFALGLAGDRLVYRRLVAAGPAGASGRPRSTSDQPRSRDSATGLTAPRRWPRSC
jgi:hypothetical protein